MIRRLVHRAWSIPPRLSDHPCMRKHTFGCMANNTASQLHASSATDGDDNRSHSCRFPSYMSQEADSCFSSRLQLVSDHAPFLQTGGPSATKPMRKTIKASTGISLETRGSKKLMRWLCNCQKLGASAMRHKQLTKNPNRNLLATRRA